VFVVRSVIPLVVLGRPVTLKLSFAAAGVVLVWVADDAFVVVGIDDAVPVVTTFVDGPAAVHPLL
jgi:hypothetical protein